MTGAGLQTEIVPLETAPDVTNWEQVVKAAGSPVFYATRFLKSIATAPLLAVDSASLLLLRDRTGIVAGVPVFLQNRIDPLHHLAELYAQVPDLPTSNGLLGHCWHCYDSQIVALRRNNYDVRPLIDAFRALARTVGADYFGLVNVADPYTLNAMASSGLTPQYMVDRYVMEIETFSSFDDYIAALHPDSRRELRRQFRRYRESSAAVTVESAPFRDLDEVALLCRRTAARYQAEFYYPGEQTQALLENMGDVLRLISVRLGGERIGVVICFFDPPRFHVWAAGMRYDRTAFSPYAIGITEAIRFAIANGFKIIEGGRGNGRIKKKQGFLPLRLHACLQRP
ncbi:MAG: hypothetical protein QOJ84_3497 [Bradyrhizobium sp.]|jgi:hypothetical protein|nr:hypothetical protein [Bradyrhizobium sp.]